MPNKARTLESFTPTQRMTDFDAMRARIDQMERDAAGASKPSEIAAGDVTEPGNIATRRKSSRRSTAMDSPTTLVHSPANKRSFEDYLAIAKELGTEAGKGKDVQIKFALQLVEGGYLGVLNTDPNRHGTDRSDAFVLAAEYAKAQGISTVFDAKPANERKLLSNTKKMIDFGAQPQWGEGEPLNNVNALMTEHQRLKKSKDHVGRLNDPFNTLSQYITAQKKSPQLFEIDQLRTYCFKKSPADRAIDQVWEAMRKLASKLAEGKVPHCPDADPEAGDVVKLCTKRLTALAKERGDTPKATKRPKGAKQGAAQGQAAA